MQPGDMVLTDGVIAQMTHAKWEQVQARIAELETALLTAQSALSSAHEAAVLRGVSVHWDIIEPRLRRAHDAVTQALS